MSSVNKVILIGNLGRDPEIRYTNEGSKIVNLSVATSENWKDRTTGERREKTEWHRVVVFNERIADVCEQYLKKGSKVFLEGQLQTRKWTDAQGVEKYTTEVVLQRYRGELTMLDSRGGSSNTEALSDQNWQGGSSSGARGGSDRSSTSSGGEDTGQHLDDEIPF